MREKSWDANFGEVVCSPAEVDAFADACVDAAMAEAALALEVEVECEHDYVFLDPGGFRCRRCGDCYVSPAMDRVFALRERD